MTENDLFAYQRAIKEYNRAKDGLSEILPLFCSSGVAHITGLPKDDPPASPDRITIKIDVKDQYVYTLKRAEMEMRREFDILSKIKELLCTESEKEFFHYRYIKGLKPKDICTKIFRSKSSLYNDRRAILQRVASITLRDICS